MSWLGKFAGAALGAVGGIWANRQQNKQFQMNYDLARNQLYNQHQIEVADLRAAGLNPILSANGGNSTFGASAGGSYENVGSAANSGFMAAQQAKNLEAQNAAIDANIVKTKAEAQNVIADTALKQAQTAHEKGLLSLIPLQRQNIWAMTEQAKAQTENWKMQVKAVAQRGLEVRDGAGDHLRNAVHGFELVKRRAVDARRERDPKVGQVVFLKVGVKRGARHARHAVQRRECERS